MDKKVFNKIHLASLSIAFIGLLFPIKVSSICVILFTLTSIIKLLFFTSKPLPKINKKVLLFSGFYGLYLLGLIYTENITVAKQLLEKNITLFLIPLLMFYTAQFQDKKIVFKVIFPFAIATQLFALFYLLSALHSFYSSGNSLDFYYDNLTSFTNFHPIYFSVYLFFSFLIFLMGFSEKYLPKNKLLFTILFLFNYILLILLSSKNVLAVFFLFLSVYSLKYLKKKIFLFPLIVSFILISVFNFSNTKNRINNAIFSNWDLLKKEQFLYNDDFTGVTLRLITWKFVSKKMFLENNFIFGVGTGDSQDFIDAVYKEHNMDAAGYLGFDMHNQFLEYFVRFGFLGLFYFLIILFVCFKNALYNNNDLYFWFLILFVSVSFTDSTLDLHRGIVFFTLFNFFFFFNKTPTKIIDL